MAKKRRRRRVDGAKPAPAAGTPPPKTAAAASPIAREEQQDADEDGADDEDAGIALPPMPSELGRGAVMAAQVRICQHSNIFNPGFLAARRNGGFVSAVFVCFASGARVAEQHTAAAPFRRRAGCRLEWLHKRGGTWCGFACLLFDTKNIALSGGCICMTVACTEPIACTASSSSTFRMGLFVWKNVSPARVLHGVFMCLPSSVSAVVAGAAGVSEQDTTLVRKRGQ